MPRRDPLGRALDRLVTLLAAGVAVGIALALPGMHALSGSAREAAEMRAEVRLAAAAVADLAGRVPELWRFESARLAELLPRLDGPGDRRRVVDAAGAVLAEHPSPPRRPAWPLLVVSEPVLEQGIEVARVEAARSLRPLLADTAAVALLAVVGALLAFAGLRAAPLRMMRGAVAEAAYLAHHDTLTGLPNRALFEDRLAQAAARARRGDAPMAALSLGLDGVRGINQTLGHAAGDALLREVASRLRACLRGGDTLARLGPEEFAVVQAGVGGPADAEALARRLVEALAAPVAVEGRAVPIGLSVGIALHDGRGDPAGLRREAEVAMRRAEAEAGAGGGRVRFFAEGMDRQAAERQALERDLRAAVAAGQLRLHYQPQVDLASGRVTGAEALLRWEHPVRGTVAPDRFVPLAEETGLILPIGGWVLAEACRQAALWPGLRMAVNASPLQLRQPGFDTLVAAAMAGAGIGPGRLEIEITEGTLLTDTDETLATLERLRALGVTLAMDDFGTGYSSLGYLQRFRFDKIKIDRGFVRGLGQDPQAAALVRAVLGIGQALGMRANAEGVETEAQAALLRAEGCAEVQGYLFGRPMPPEAFEALLAARSGLRAA